MALAFRPGWIERMKGNLFSRAECANVEGAYMMSHLVRGLGRIYRGLATVLAVSLASNAFAVHQTGLNLGTAITFSIVTGDGITNTGVTQIIGDIASSPITAAAMNQVPCSVMNGYYVYGVDVGYTDGAGCSI